MRILHVTHQYPPAIGGSEKYVADLSEELVTRGHQVDVFTSRSLDYNTWKSELPARERANGVEVYRFRSIRRTRLVWAVLRWSLGRYWATGARGYETLILFGGGPLCPGMFRRILAEGRGYDVIHLNCLVYSHVWYGYWAARRRGVPVVLTPHTHIGQKATYALGYQLRALHGCDHVIADTEGEREFLLALGLDPLRVTTVGVGLRPAAYPERDKGACRARLGLPADAFVVLFLGRQVEYKGLGTALDAIVRLRSDNPQIRYLVVGPDTEYSRRLLAQCADRSMVVSLGKVPDDVRLDALSSCDCLVLPSAGEAFGIAFLEAWIMGKPVIGPRMPAITSLVSEGRDGWLVPVGNPVAIAGALQRWIDDPALVRQMGENGRRKVLERYTCARAAESAEAVYLRTLGTHDRAQAAGSRPLDA